jgi:hypothetical protein
VNQGIPDSRTEKKALKILSRRGACGASALDLAETGAEGLEIAAALVAQGKAVVTKGNRFVATEHAGGTLPQVVTWDDDEVARRVIERGKAPIRRTP